MRLLNVDTFKLEEFLNEELPVYATLSHRWGHHELTFQDIDEQKAGPGPSLDKITGCCRVAKKAGIQWVRVDTCCIDKRSSSELTEAINSMFQWYRRAVQCFIYLGDVSDDGVDFANSNWFKRGWTLQELLASELAVFFDASWQKIGTKKELVDKLPPSQALEHCFWRPQI